MRPSLQYIKHSLISKSRITDYSKCSINSLFTSPIDPSQHSVQRRFHSSESGKRHLQLKLYDSLTKSLKEVQSNGSKGIACYTCGPTTYAPAHLGHARTYVWLDIFRRLLEWTSSTSESSAPLFVMNITDVDDKILVASASDDEPPLEFARRWEAEFWKDWDSLNCLRPHIVTRVSEYVESDIVPYIERLVQSGMAYTTPNGVYFDVRMFEEKMQTITRYGKLAPPAQSNDFYSRLEETLNDKRSLKDFALWKTRKPGERMYWSSPWGEGRPGWHIECSAMIEAVQKEFSDSHVFSLHAGGIDLQFPHHCNEIAQAEAYNAANLHAGQEWIPHWIHTGHLYIDGRKMSKSLKNFITIADIINEGSNEKRVSYTSPADDFRLWCLGLSGSYRTRATYSRERLLEASKLREKLVRFLLDGEEWVQSCSIAHRKKWSEEDYRLFGCARSVLKKSLGALASDLDGVSFLKEVVSLVDIGNIYIQQIRTTSSQWPSEPLRLALDELRQILRLVGFTESTWRAGLEDTKSNTAEHSNIVGCERALLDTVVNFRKQVREIALSAIRSADDPTAALQRILVVCDDAREHDFPKLGIAINDGKIEEGGNKSHWHYLPVSTYDLGLDHETSTRNDMTAKLSHNKTKATALSLEDLMGIPLQDFFRRGLYQDMFTEYDSEGMPTINADGTPVSNRQRKKLLKKLEKHATRLEENDPSKPRI